MSQNFNLIEVAFSAMKYFVPFLFALCFHEFAHGWVARLRGDRTAEIMGRLTLNPAAHADMIGTVLLPLISFVTHFPLIGWAKPVPVDERNLKNPKADMFWIAFAGPASNLLLAFVGAVVLGLFGRFFETAIMSGAAGPMEVESVLTLFITINVFLAIFNLLPIHPLDGGKILARFLPDRMNDQLESWSQYMGMALMALMLFGGLRIISVPAGWLTGLFIDLANGLAFT